MDYEGTRDSASEVPMGEVALARPASDVTAAAAASASTGGMALIPDANNTVVLPDGASLDDIAVRGRDLVIQLDDGRIFIIPDGAVFVPQIVAQGVTVPPLNLAALLTGQEPEPAAGPVRSSGGNFAEAVNPLQDAYDLGDLLPYTELAFPEPRQREIFPTVDREPEIIIVTPDNPAGAVNATASVDEAGLPVRGDDESEDVEPAGSDSAANSETTSGTIVVSSPDGIGGLTVGGVTVALNGVTVITTARGVLTITGNGTSSFAYSYTLTDNTSGEGTRDPFSVVVTDADGDTATGTLTIRIIDDEPTAINDTDTVAAGTYGPETGNVLTGAGTTSGAAGADILGADDASLTGMRAGTSGSFVAPGGAGGISGTYGKLTFNTDGSYGYVRNPGTPGGVDDVFSYQITDGDGDVSTATLIISIADALPLAGEDVRVLLDDDALANGNPSGAGDDVDGANLEGTLAASGGDGPLTWALATTGAPDGFSYVATATGINVLQGTTIVLKVTLDPATGAYTVAQVAPIQHTDGGDENNQQFTLDYTVTDQDNDTARGKLTINVDDDTPTVEVVREGEVAALVVDETTLVGTSAENFSGLFVHSFGADGEGSVAYAMGVVAGPSGLIDTLSGQSVVLSIVGGVVEGRTESSNLLVFTASVAADGEVTLTQSRAVVHDPDLGPDDVASLAGSLVTLTQTVTDSDGDAVSATVNIGALLNFVDDAPNASDDSDSIASGSYGPATGNVLTDASLGDDGDTDTGADSVGNDGGEVTAVTGFYGAEGTIGGETSGEHGVLVLNEDGSYTYTRNPGTPGGVTDTFIYTVTDGDGDTVTAKLVITIGDAQPKTAENAAVLLDDDALAGGNPGGTAPNGTDDDVDGANLEGTLAASGGDGPLTWSLATTGAPDGFSYVATATGLNVLQGNAVVLEVTLNTTTGAYKVVQVAPIDHAAGEGENNTPFTFNYTVTDQDGDPADGTLSVNVDDDTPIAADDTDSIASGSSAPATGNVLTDASPGDDGDGDTGADSMGADGGTITAITGFEGAAGAVNGTTAGQYGVLTLNADGSYSYARNDGTPGDVEDVFTYTITDSDGDTDTATLTITIQDAAPITARNDIVLLDDDALKGGNPGGTAPDGTDDDVDAAFISGTLGGSGGDGALTWALLTTDAPLGFSYVANGAGIDVLQGDTLVLQVTLTPSTGAYKVVQVAPIIHAAGGAENNQLFKLNYTVSDADLDSAQGTLEINVDDDSPLAANDTDAVTEDGPLVASGNVLTGVGSDGKAAGADSLGADGPAVGGAVTAIAGGTIGSPRAGSYGSITLNANGGYTYTLDNDNPAVQALDTDDAPLLDVFTYTITDRDGDTITATITITINGANDAPKVGTGTAVVSEEGLGGANADTTGSTDTTNSLIAGGTILATDVDGETLTYSLGDPGAVLTSNGDTVTWTGVGTGLLIGSAGGGEVIRVTIDGSGNYQVTLGDNVDHSLADVEDLKTFTVPVDVSDGTTSTGSTITVTIEDDSPIAFDDPAVTIERAPAIDGNVLENDLAGADAPGTVIFLGTAPVGTNTVILGSFGTLTISSTGAYSYVPKASVPSGSVDSFSYTMRDFDGDTAIATLSFTYEGDANLPIAGTAAATVDDDGLANGQPDGDGDLDANVNDTPLTASEAIFAGTLPRSFGLDGPGVVSLAHMAGTTATIGSEQVTYAWESAGNFLTATITGGDRDDTLLFTVQVDPATGTYTVYQFDNVLHASGGTENDASVVLTYRVTDSDSTANPATYATGTLTITFDDDSPTATALGAQPTLVVDETVLATNATESFAATFSTAFGADGAAAANSLVYTLGINAGATGLFDVATGNEVVLSLESGQVVGHAGIGGDIVFVVSVAADGKVTLDQRRAVEHDDPGDPDEPGDSAATLLADNLITLTATATDADGDTASAIANIGQNLRFEDDGPSLGIIQNQTVSNDPAQTPAIGTLHFAAGADGAGSTMTIGANISGITSGGKAIYTQQAGNVLTGYADTDSSGGYTDGDTAVFTLTVDPSAGTSGQYVFNLLSALDTQTTNVSVGSATSFGAGPTASQVLTSGATNLAVVSGWETGGGFNAANWFNGTNALPAGLTLSSVNGSTGGWGIKNQNFNANEFMRFDFGAPMDDFDGAGPYTTAAVTLPEVSYATFDLDFFGATDVIQFRIHYTDGTSSNASVTGPQTDYTLTAPANKFIDWIDIYSPTVGTGSAKIALTDVGVTSTSVNRTIPFTLTLTDGDGDSTAATNFSVQVTTNGVPANPVPPVVLDLDGDGAEFLSLAAGVAFDYNGDGSAQSTAWAGADDGLLAIDRNGDGEVNDGSEIVFGGNGLTDLQGLAASYDSNGDGVLSAADAAFAQFGVWQDANSDGVTQDGEFASLTAMGITSIGLVSDGAAYSAADGDVAVAGEAAYTKTDGSTGIVADASFALGGTLRQTDRSGELIAASSAAAGLLAAMAAEHVSPSATDSAEEANLAVETLPQPASIEADTGGDHRAGFAVVDPALMQLADAPARSGRTVEPGDAAASRAELGQSVERQSTASEGNDGAKSALFDHGDNAVMEALLAQGAAATATGAQVAAAPAIAAALEDSANAEAVDSIVDHFAGASSESPEQLGQSASFGFESLLQLGVSGSSTDLAGAQFGMMQAFDHEQANAMA